MVLAKLNALWDYCTYNKLFFLFILILIIILNFIQNYSITNYDGKGILLIQMLFIILLQGYGMSITRDRINHGYRLPKIIVKDVILLGIKSIIVIGVYLFIQGIILDLICSPLDFPSFNLEEMLLDWANILHLLYVNNPINTLIFIFLGGITFYTTAFFGEVGLARLADTRSLLSAFNLIEIYKNINLYGWRNYAKDYTKIILLIVFFSYLKNGLILPVSFFEWLFKIFLGFLIFATEFLGIGAVYCVIKDKKLELEKSG